MSTYAQHFYEIEEVVEQNDDVCERALELIANEPISGNATEGGDRLETFRNILTGFFGGDLTFEDTIERIPQELPRHESPHSGDTQHTFSDGWDERLARTQISRFYNQAVLELLDEDGEDEVFIPHSRHEDRDTNCTIHLAGGTANIEILLERLNRAYRDGDWHDEVMIPDHPHCTHTVTLTQ